MDYNPFMTEASHLQRVVPEITPEHRQLLAVSATGAWIADWGRLGRCAGTNPDALFVQGKAQRAAKIICKGCPVVAECLADALDNRTEFGVWGGMTERERRALLRRRPDVKSWTALLSAAKLEKTEPLGNTRSTYRWCARYTV